MKSTGSSLSNLIFVAAALAVLRLAFPVLAQQRSAVVPTLVNYSGAVTDINGKVLSGVHAVTFYLYRDPDGGAPLWMETQNVQADRHGRYTAMLGSTTNEGLPTELFAAGEARWLAVQAEGQAEQPRILLLSVPYALKAADAQTLGGLPASAFALAVPSPSSSSTVTVNSASADTSDAPPPTGSVTGSGTLDFIPLWNSTSAIGNSVLFQSGSGSTAKVGISTTTPGATLDVKGTTNLEGLLTLPAQGSATAAAGKSSQPQDLVGTLLLRVEGNTLRMRKSGLLSLEPETGRIVDSELAISASLIGELARANEVLPTLAPARFSCPNNPTLLARCQAESGCALAILLARCNICAMDEEVLKKARIELARQGGKARAKSLSAEERRRIATKASNAAARARSLKAKQKANNRKS